MKINKRYVIISGILLFLTISGSFIYLEFKNTRRPLNVLLITIDALRADHLSCYGYGRDTSPHIDELARRGVLFTQAISQGPTTIPSVPSLMTSLYPSEHGIKTPWQRYAVSVPVLAQILKQNGYYTGLIVDNSQLSHTGMGWGFDSRDFSFDKKADVLTQKAINWLIKNKDKRFFLWLHYLDPHGPYRPPQPYDKKYLNDNLYKHDKHIPISTHKEEQYLGEYLDVGCIPLYAALDGRTDPDYYIAQYDGEISFTDAQIGILLKALENFKLDNKTLIIITADHGEHQGEHNYYFFHKFLYDEVIRVPLIMKCDEILPRGKIIDYQVGHIDIMPTILGLLGIRAGVKTSGISLVQAILKDKSPPRRIIFSELFIKSTKYPYLTQPLAIALRTSEWKLIYRPIAGEYQLYNLKKDPKELNNLIDTEKTQFAFLKQKLEEHMYDKSNSFAKSPELKGSIDKELKKKLESLGYMQ